MKCSYCAKGKGKNYTKDKEGNIYYYYCMKCVGDFKARCPFCGGEFVTFQTKDLLEGATE